MLHRQEGIFKRLHFGFALQLCDAESRLSDHSLGVPELVPGWLKHNSGSTFSS